jgi:uroporphyrinogen-III synthase
MRVLVTRPREDGVAIAARLSAMGHAPLLAPLLEPVFEAGAEPDFSGVQAILCTSANGVRALVRRSARRDLPVFAVGPQTSAEARDAGFADVRNADGDARALARQAAHWASPDRGALLHVCGEDSNGGLAQDLEGSGFGVRRAVLYRMEAAPVLPAPARGALAAGDVDAALFFSPRSARIFHELAKGLPLGRVTALAISPVTAEALRGFGQVRVAAQPNQDALLALL